MKVRIGEVELSYQEAGRGVPLLLVHGFPLSRAMWQPQIRALSAELRVLAPDLRGFGESRALTAPPSPLSIDQYADDLARFLEALSTGPVVLAGLSMGGYIALSFVRRHRHLLRGLVLVDTKAAADTPEARENRYRTAEKIKEGQKKEVFEGLLSRLLGKYTQAERPGVVSAARRMMEEAPVEGVIQALYAMAERPDSTPFLPSIDLPTLVFVGEEDELTPPAEARVMAEKIPNASLEIIPRAGHLANLENPEPFNKALLQFVKRL